VQFIVKKISLLQVNDAILVQMYALLLLIPNKMEIMFGGPEIIGEECRQGRKFSLRGLRVMNTEGWNNQILLFLLCPSGDWPIAGCSGRVDPAISII